MLLSDEEVIYFLFDDFFLILCFTCEIFINKTRQLAVYITL